MTEQAERHAPDKGMPLETMVHGLRLAIACALRTGEDLRVAGGAALNPPATFTFFTWH